MSQIGAVKAFFPVMVSDVRIAYN